MQLLLACWFSSVSTSMSSEDGKRNVDDEHLSGMTVGVRGVVPNA